MAVSGCSSKRLDPNNKVLSASDQQGSIDEQSLTIRVYEAVEGCLSHLGKMPRLRSIELLFCANIVGALLYSRSDGCGEYGIAFVVMTCLFSAGCIISIERQIRLRPQELKVTIADSLKNLGLIKGEAVKVKGRNKRS